MASKEFLIFKKKIADKVKLLRAEKKISKDKLIELTGFNKRYIDQLENGEISPSYKARCVLAKVFGVEESYFTSDEKELLYNKKEE